MTKHDCFGDHYRRTNPLLSITFLLLIVSATEGKPILVFYVWLVDWGFLFVWVFFCAWPKWGSGMMKRIEEKLTARNNLWIFCSDFTGRDRI